MMLAVVSAACALVPASAVTVQPVKAARFSLRTQQGAAPLRVQFNAAVLAAGDASGTSLQWDFGDGASAVGAEGDHTYTQAGTFTVRLDVLANGVVTDSYTSKVVVRPAELASIRLDPSASSLFTGNSVSVALQGYDRFGNPVPIEHVTWSATDGTAVTSTGSTALFTAGRQPGTAVVTATAGDGTGEVKAAASLTVREGYCTTEHQQTQWTVQWQTAKGNGAPLTSPLPATFTLDGPPAAAQGLSVTGLQASSQIVVRRQGPVHFGVKASGALRLTVDGVAVLDGQGGGDALVNLTPGVHVLGLDYTWTGAPDLSFNADGDVLEWDAIAQCTGGYVTTPAPGYALLVTQAPITTVADRFGVPASALVRTEEGGREALLIPGKAHSAVPTKVILVSGLGSQETCSPSDPTDEHLLTIAHAIQEYAWKQTGVVSAISGNDFVGFSYSGNYVDCAGSRTPPAANPSAPGVRAAYTSQDTCEGVASAAAKLGRLVGDVLAETPNAHIYLIGHSLGGMVAAYYLATAPANSGIDAVQGLITLDSPLDGYRGPEIGLSCAPDSPTRMDLRAGTSVVPTIMGLSDTPWAHKTLAINSTFVGNAIGPDVMTVSCDPPAPPTGSLFNSLITMAVDTFVSEHDCGFTSPNALQAMAQMVNASGPAGTPQPTQASTASTAQ